VAKRKKVQPEDRLVKVIKILKPEYEYEVVRILKAVAVMLNIKSFSHERDE